MDLRYTDTLKPTPQKSGGLLTKKRMAEHRRTSRQRNCSSPQVAKVKVGPENNRSAKEPCGDTSSDYQSRSETVLGIGLPRPPNSNILAEDGASRGRCTNVKPSPC